MTEQTSNPHAAAAPAISLTNGTSRSAFFSAIRLRPFPGRMTAEQVGGMEKVLDRWEQEVAVKAEHDVRHLAYRFATVFRETGARMVPVLEGGSDHYLRSKPYWPYIGAGLVQVTWLHNYHRFGARTAEEMLEWPNSLRALFDGMRGGVFTTRKLADYFNDRKDDPVQARRIINGTDKAALVAGYHRDFLAALKGKPRGRVQVAGHAVWDKARELVG